MSTGKNGLLVMIVIIIWLSSLKVFYYLFKIKVTDTITLFGVTLGRVYSEYSVAWVYIKTSLIVLSL